MRENLVVYPVTADPQEIKEIQMARHDPAFGAQQVMWHSGGFFEEANDLFVPSVGFPFKFTRHYKSDVKTLAGGLIGHKWDFNLNHRIVPVFPRITGDGLAVEIINVDTPQLYYYDGTLHADRYVAKAEHQQRRQVINFGKTFHQQQVFEALVTTYEGPPHAFLEIRRYVLFDPSQHPFKEHVNVREELGEAIFYVVRMKDGFRLIFNCRGQMIYAIDRHNNVMEFRYLGPLNPLIYSPMLSEIIDTSGAQKADPSKTREKDGRRYRVRFVNIDTATMNTNIDCKPVRGTFPIPRIKEIVDFAGRKIVFNYKNSDTEPVLESIRREFGDVHMTTRYGYEGEHLLTQIISPKEASGQNRPYLKNTYDGEQRVVAQQIGQRRHTINYGGPITVTDNARNTREYTLERLPGTVVVSQFKLTSADPKDGGPWIKRYSHNTATQITGITYPSGNSIAYEYDAENEPVALGVVRDARDPELTYENNLSRGNLLSVTRLSNNPKDDYAMITESIEYEPLFNQLSSYADPRGVQTRYQFDYDKSYGYNGVPRLIEDPTVTRPDGTVLSNLKRELEYSDRGEPVTVAQDGFATRYGYDAHGYLVRVGFPDGNSRTFNMDNRGNVTRLQEPGELPPTDYTYDLRDLATAQIEDPDGFANRIDYRYDLNGNLILARKQVQDVFHSAESAQYGVRPKFHGGVSTQFELDLVDQVTKITVQGYDTSYESSQTYDALGNVASVTVPSPSGNGTLTVRQQHDARGLIRTVDRGSERTEYRYDRNGSVVEVKDGLGRRTTYLRDGFDRVRATIDPNGGMLRQKLDPNGNVEELEFIGSTGDPGGPPATLLKTTTEYDEYNRAVLTQQWEIQRPGFVETKYLYGRLGYLEKQIGPGTGERRYEHDAMGRLRKATDPMGNIVEYDYSPTGAVVKMTEREVEVKYDSLDRKAGLGVGVYVTTIGHDPFGRPNRRTLPGSRTARMFYDSEGRVRVAVDETGRVTQTEYNAQGRVTRVLRGGQETEFAYTSGGLKKRMTMPGGGMEWDYDALGRVVKIQNLANGATTSKKYDAVGQPTEIIDPNGTRLTIAYNAQGLKTKVSVDARKAKVKLVGPSEETFRYDGLGRIVFAGNNRGASVRRSYDGVGNMTREDQTFGRSGQSRTYTLTTEHKADQSQRTLTLPRIGGPAAGPIQWSYDPLGRVTRVQVGSDFVAAYDHSGVNRIGRRSYGNLVHTHWSYDAGRRVSEMHVDSEIERRSLWRASARYHGNAPIDIGEFFSAEAPEIGESRSARMTLDGQQRPLVAVTTTVKPGRNGAPPTQWVSRTYNSYRPDDNLEETVNASFSNGQLTEVRSDRFTFTGGRIASTLTRLTNQSLNAEETGFDRFAALEWLRSPQYSESQAFEYDGNGNITRDAKYAYSYDYLNRVTRIDMIWDERRQDSESIHYYYDAFGRRVFQEHSPRTPQVLRYNRQDIRFLYDGDRVVAEILHPYRGEPVLLARYIHGARGDELVRMDRRINDEPNGRMAVFYLHEGFTGGVNFLTDENFRGLVRIGTRDHFYLQENMIEGTNTRLPYRSWSVRWDAFSNSHLDEKTKVSTIDYRSAPIVAWRVKQDRYLAEIRAATAEIQRAQLKIMGVFALPAAPMLPAAAWAGGLISVGVDYGITSFVGGEYSAEQAMTAFALGGLGGGVGSSLKAVSSLSTAGRIVAEAGIDIAAGTIVDMAAHGDTFSHSIIQNFLYSAIGAASARVQAAVEPQSGSKAIAKRQAGLEALSIEGSDGPPLSKKQYIDMKRKWRKGLEAPEFGAAEIEKIMEVLRTGFTMSNGRVAYGARKVLELLGEEGMGTLEMFRPGMGTNVCAGQIILDPTLVQSSQIASKNSGVVRWIYGQANHERGYIRINPFNPDGTPRTPADMALTIIHEYAHLLGANERLARRIEYFSYLRLKRSQYASEIAPERWVVKLDKSAEEAWENSQILAEQRRQIRMITDDPKAAQDGFNLRQSVMEKALHRMTGGLYEDSALKTKQSVRVLGGSD
jgi:YD repeat-containing protein